MFQDRLGRFGGGGEGLPSPGVTGTAGAEAEHAMLLSVHGVCKLSHVLVLVEVGRGGGDPEAPVPSAFVSPRCAPSPSVPACSLPRLTSPLGCPVWCVPRVCLLRTGGVVGARGVRPLLRSLQWASVDLAWGSLPFPFSLPLKSGPAGVSPGLTEHPQIL